MNKKEKLAFAVVAALAMSGGGFAVAQSVNNVSSDQVIYACVTGVNGNIVRVSNTRKTCPRGTTPISWNMVGPQGIQGIPGTAVAKGDKGDQGIAGETGPAGPAGPSSSGFYMSGPEESKYYLLRYPDLYWKDGTEYYLQQESGFLFPNILPTAQPWPAIALGHTTTHLTTDCSDPLFIDYYDPLQDDLALKNPEVTDSFISMSNSEGTRWFKTTAILTDKTSLDFKAVHVQAGQRIWWEKDMPVAQNDICKPFSNYVDFINSANALRELPPLSEDTVSWMSRAKMIVGSVPASFVKLGELQHD